MVRKAIRTEENEEELGIGDVDLRLGNTKVRVLDHVHDVEV